jgi:hypothetical protein
MSGASFRLIGNAAHGATLANKAASSKDASLTVILRDYQVFLEQATALTFDLENRSSTEAAIAELTRLLNAYRQKSVPVLESRDNSGQENLRSTILEEFFSLLLSPLVVDLAASHPSALVLGKANSYVSLTFAPKCFPSMFSTPAPYVHTKDQDLVLGCMVKVRAEVCQDDAGHASVSNQSQFVVPAVVIECKTYIERNMLDSCAGTAKRLKTAMPYCLFFVVAEYMKMDDAFPELTDIDEVFILTKASNADRLKHSAKNDLLHAVHSDLVVDIFFAVARHLNRIWWSPEDAVQRGFIISRP